MDVKMDIEEIQKVLPHRYPFLLVDRIVELKDTYAIGYKNVTINDHFFQGHFPNKPVMPGVLMLEGMAQVGAVMILSKKENAGKIVYLASVTNARFRKVVVPGDRLFFRIDVVRMKSKVGIISCKATVEDEEVCSAEIMFSLGG